MGNAYPSAECANGLLSLLQLSVLGQPARHTPPKQLGYGMSYGVPVANKLGHKGKGAAVPAPCDKQAGGSKGPRAAGDVDLELGGGAAPPAPVCKQNAGGLPSAAPQQAQALQADKTGGGMAPAHPYSKESGICRPSPPVSEKSCSSGPSLIMQQLHPKEPTLLSNSVLLRRSALLLLIIIVTALSAFFLPWLEGRDDLYLESVVRFGSIPLIAALIGYGTNVVALWMMFWPLEFVGILPRCKLGPPLDFYLFGYQGVIPMKAREMSELSYEMISTKLVTVEEIFDRLDPELMQEQMRPVLVHVIRAAIEESAFVAFPNTWERLPTSIRDNIVKRSVEQAGPVMQAFIKDMKRNIHAVFDLKHCVVELMVNNKEVLVDMFTQCGEAELVVIKTMGFYLGYIFGVFQMLIWLFARDWWILPLCGVIVGYLTNAIALKIIFNPVTPRRLFGGYTLHGLFLQRQKEVSRVYAKAVSERVLSSENLLKELCYGVRSQQLKALVGTHVELALEEQATSHKTMLQMTVGMQAWRYFQDGVKVEFQQRLPTLLWSISSYMDEAMSLEVTLRERLEALPSHQFERLLHTVFEKDEFKLILVGAVLGALVGFIQAMCQTPEQLGLA